MKSRFQKPMIIGGIIVIVLCICIMCSITIYFLFFKDKSVSSSSGSGDLVGNGSSGNLVGNGSGSGNFEVNFGSDSGRPVVPPVVAVVVPPVVPVVVPINQFPNSVNYGDKIRIKKYGTNYSLRLADLRAAEVDNCIDDNCTLTIDSADNTNSGPVKYGDLIFVAKAKDNSYRLWMYDGKGEEKHHNIDVDTQFRIQSANNKSGEVQYDDKIHIAKDDIYRLKLYNKYASESKHDVGEHTTLIISKV
jgi:hypothetical protein